MEIVEEGQKLYTCEDCGCMFRITSEKEVNRDDWKYVTHGFLIPETKRAYFDWVKCPQCGNKIIIKWREEDA